jgi:nucleoside diphosphate kinase
MQDKINQAVVFTKPVHHLGLSLTPKQLDEQTQAFFEGKGFRFVSSKQLTGTGLAERDVIKQHYLMYSKAACIQSVDELELTDEAKLKFESAFGESWQAEAGKVMGSPALQQEKGISSHELYLRWNEQFSSRRTCKIQDGVIMAWLADLDCYCINAFYPVMEENFYNLATEIAYHVIEFDPNQVSWSQFRKNILGATDASKAEPGSFRGQLYSAHQVDYPGRDNFVHGSAGPLEGLVERTIHEQDFDMAANPVGLHLLERGVSLERFGQWKSSRSIAQLGALFDATEEKDTAGALDLLAEIRF